MAPIRLSVTKPDAGLTMYEAALDPRGPMALAVGTRGQLFVPGGSIEPPYNITIVVMPDQPSAEGK